MLSVIITALTQMKHGSMVIGFTRQAMQYSPLSQKPQKGLLQTMSVDGLSHGQEVLRKKALRKLADP